jgi:hypothetical protein
VRIRLICRYCGEDWHEFLYDAKIDHLKCCKCGDRNLKPIKEEKHDSFGYKTERHEDAYLKPKGDK